MQKRVKKGEYVNDRADARQLDNSPTIYQCQGSRNCHSRCPTPFDLCGSQQSRIDAFSHRGCWGTQSYSIGFSLSAHYLYDVDSAGVSKRAK